MKIGHWALIVVFVTGPVLSATPADLFVEVESFEQLGGWVIDQQSWDVIGSSYLLAHGMGKPVNDAITTVTFPATGSYHLWVRTKDWAPYPVGPGAFEVHINGRAVDKVFGTGGSAQWDWYYGGQISIDKTDVQLKLHDLMGFEGRCDALYFIQGDKTIPPTEQSALETFRRKKLNLPEVAQDAGDYDLVVVGGGIAGICAAVQGARLGLDVALIQNRPVLGGNNSSEIRVHLVGRTDKNLYPRLGQIVRELQLPDQGNAHVDGSRYGDAHKLRIVQAEPKLDLFLNNHVFAVDMDGTRIQALTARNIATARELRFRGKLFADCTGDGTLGYLAGADYRMGRESRAEHNEPMAPILADDFTLGTSNLWHASDHRKASDFPACPWALPFSDAYYIDHPKADWKWETGFGNFNTISEAEAIRDHNFRAIYGNWAYLKNHKKEKYKNYALDWVAYIGGKRESRRLLGDHILTQQDIDESRRYPDASATGTWTIDLHFPDKRNSEHFKGQEFFSGTIHHRRKPYHIPYRCFYSRNIDSLFMAGRNISTTHVAFGSTRVMRTGGMMGEVVGMAAYVAHKHESTPRGVYQEHLAELIDLFKTGSPRRHVTTKPNILFIAVDDLRPQLGCYGQSQMKTPHMDRLAAEGAFFRRTYCNIAVCGASRASIMTGLRPTRTRFTSYKTYMDQDAPGVTTLPQHFKEHGYYTMSLGKVFHHLDDGLQSWSERPWRPDYPDSIHKQVNWRDYHSEENLALAKKHTPPGETLTLAGLPYEAVDAPDDIYYDGRVTNRAIEELNKLSRQDRPFFLGVGYVKPHLPFNAPQKYWDLYAEDEIKMADNPWMPQEAPGAAKCSFGELRGYIGIPKQGPVSEEMAHKLVHGYYAATSYVDALVGRLLAELKKLGLEENTYVILWGDHGWFLGEHGFWCKHSTFHDATHCAMMIKGPDIKQGSQIKGLTEYIDIYPSLCELAGLPQPAHLQGQSFKTLLDQPISAGKDAIYTRYGRGEAIKTDRYMYTEFQDKRGKTYARMLYDHHNDPAENKNRAEEPAYQDTVTELSRKLNRKISELNR